MTVRVVGFWERGWNTPMHEMDLYEMIIRDFAVDGFHMSPVSGILNEYVTEHASYDDAVVAMRATGSKMVFVSESATTNLADFTHPEDATYVMGKVSFDPMVTYFQEGDEAIVIPTNVNQGLLWPHQALGIVLYDRLMKAS
jgi:tRNA(Leu) C34 or U34 (ribose-2'-O)-methylase TrmL